MLDIGMLPSADTILFQDPSLRGTKECEHGPPFFRVINSKGHNSQDEPRSSEECTGRTFLLRPSQ